MSEREHRPELDEPTAPRPAARWRAFFAWSESTLIGASFVGLCAWLASEYTASLDEEVVVPGVHVAGLDIGGWDLERMRAGGGGLSAQLLDAPLHLTTSGGARIDATPRQLGADAELEGVATRALRVGRTGAVVEDLMTRAAARAGDVRLTVPMAFDEAQALDVLAKLSPKFDTPSLPTRLDLEARSVMPATQGTAMMPHDSLSRVAVALASGASEVDLVVRSKPAVAEDPLRSRADLAFGAVLGRFATSYRTGSAQRDRGHNLKLGSAAIDGYILDPGETFSFNAVVGDRSVEAGYRFAPGINSGEIVDVVGGGICQVASSLFAAGFFAGLDVVRARPHSRPSSYVDMGLDATVVYPSIDLKLKNPYDFPVVLHVTANRGMVEAEVLGPGRDFSIVFGRQVDAVVPFATVEREDPSLKEGHQKVVQRGMRGFTVTRTRRRLVRGEQVGPEETWRLDYPATREIIKVGTGGADAEVPERRTSPQLRTPRASFEIVQ